jgi:hypothetical protein
LEIFKKIVVPNPDLPPSLEDLKIPEKKLENLDL